MSISVFFTSIGQAIKEFFSNTKVNLHGAHWVLRRIQWTAGSVHERSSNLRPESVESPSLDEKSVKEIFSKHYARKSRDRYPKFSNKPKRLVLKKKPLVLPKVLRGELSQSSASYHFVEGESVSRVETYLDEDSSPRLFFQAKNNASREEVVNLKSPWLGTRCKNLVLNRSFPY